MLIYVQALRKQRSNTMTLQDRITQDFGHAYENGIDVTCMEKVLQTARDAHDELLLKNLPAQDVTPLVKEFSESDEVFRNHAPDALIQHDDHVYSAMRKAYNESDEAFGRLMRGLVGEYMEGVAERLA